MDLRVALGGLGLAAALGLGLWFGLHKAPPSTSAPQAREASVQSHPLKVSLGPNDPERRVPGPSELAAAFPALAALSSDQQQAVAIALGAQPGPCEPCLPNKPLSRCAIEAPAGCENLPTLITRVARLAATGADSDTLLQACSYGDAWVPGLRVPDATGPVALDVWVELSGPFLVETLSILETVAADPGVTVRTHPLLSERRPESKEAAQAAWAAEKQGLGIEFMAAVAAVRQQGQGRGAADLSDAAAQLPALQRGSWESDRSSPDAASAVEQEQALATRLGVRSSPTWFVDGYRMRGPQSAEALNRAIQREAADRGADGERPWRP